MAEIEKSGQKIKAKISKLPLSQLNVLPMIEISASSASLRHSAGLRPSASAPLSPEKTVISPEKAGKLESGQGCEWGLDEEKQQLLRHFNIPVNYGCHIRFTDGYCEQVSRERSGKLQSRLDPRDERVRVALESEYLAEFVRGGCKGDMAPLLDEVRDWVVDVVELVSSVSFSLLKRGVLSEKEAKNYAAKNMLLNVKEMFCELEAVPLQQRFQLMQFVNQQLQLVIQGLIAKYPQNTSRGATRRLKARLRRIDNREDDQYDLLYRHGVSFRYRRSGDYSPEVMAVINRLIALPGDPFAPNSEETNFEVFTEIMEYIFEGSSGQPAASTAADVAELVAQKVRAKGEDILNSTNITELRDAISFSERMEKKSSSARDSGSREYLIGQKIPAGTVSFTDSEVQGGNFRVHDSAVLRILTKWSQELREKLSNAESALGKRSHKFKLRSGKLMSLESSLKDQLFLAAQEEEGRLGGFLESLNRENTALQVAFAEERNIGRHGKLDTQVGIFAAKMNEVASQYVFKYLNRLIHALLALPRAAAAALTSPSDHSLLASLDLVTLKIGDLMRARYSCSESQFLRVLGVLEEVDCRHPEILRLVRIKNRLEQKDGDVLINFFFMERVECELQLSIRGLLTPADHNHATFNHFLYEVLRSKLGPLSELANIVTQYDPLINNFKRMRQFGPPLLEQQWLRDKKRQVLDKLIERLKFKRDIGVSRSLELPFICCKCFNLTIVTNPRFYFKAAEDLKLTCNQCRFGDMIEDCGDEAFDYLMRQSFKDEQVRSFLVRHIEHWDYEQEIKEMEEDTDMNSCRPLSIPMQGYYLKKTSKLPKMALYSAVFDPVSNSYLLMADDRGNRKAIAKIPLFLEKKKRISAFKEELKNFYFFKFEEATRRIEDGNLYLSCSRAGCCGRVVKAGPMLTPTQITQIFHDRSIQCSLHNQKSLLDLNAIPQALQSVENAFLAVDDPAKSERISRSVQQVKAVGCSLQSIEVVSRFAMLMDLNISQNLELRSLRGLEACQQLRNLESKHCDLQHVDELASLRRLECLNLKGNWKLTNINGLQGHTELVELNIAHTAVQSLQPLEKCLKLESLNIEDCRQVASLAFINSDRLAFLNMVDCTGLEEFDLQLRSSKSLRNVEYVKGRERLGLELMVQSLRRVEGQQEQEEEEQDGSAPALNIDHINQLLKSSKKSKKDALAFLTKTVT